MILHPKNWRTSTGKETAVKNLFFAACVVLSGVTVAGTGSAAVVPTNQYNIHFIIDPTASLLNPPEVVSMTLTTDTVLHSGIGAFMGLSGSRNQRPPVFYPDINPGPFLVADNLFNPSGYPNGNFVDAAGIGFFDTVSGDQYQLANDPQGSVPGVITVRVRVIPEPSTWAMVTLGFAMLGYAASRRSRTRSTVPTAA
jgi:PEP-CTERM motif